MDMADMLRLIEMDSSIYSMDVDLSVLEDRVKEIKPDNVTFLEGDSHKIEATFYLDFLHGLPHPWVVILNTAMITRLIPSSQIFLATIGLGIGMAT